MKYEFAKPFCLPFNPDIKSAEEWYNALSSRVGALQVTNEIECKIKSVY